MCVLVCWCGVGWFVLCDVCCVVRACWIGGFCCAFVGADDGGGGDGVGAGGGIGGGDVSGCDVCCLDVGVCLFGGGVCLSVFVLAAALLFAIA